MRSTHWSGGFTLLEILVVLSILGILVALGGYSYTRSINPPRQIARTVYGQLLRVRTDAMANTQARRVLLSGQDLTIQASTNCSNNLSLWSNVGKIDFDDVQRKNLTVISTLPSNLSIDPSLPEGTQLVTCFTSRGLAQAPNGQNLASLTIRDSRRIFYVDIALGGGVRMRGS